MTDSFGFSDRDPAQFANRIEPIKEELHTAILRKAALLEKQSKEKKNKK